jgi:metal-dependent amidase/aminoacylase/carboxypeptidase family protein
MKGQLFKDFVLITIIHVLIGEIAFGTSPGEAVVRATLRSYRDDDMRMLISRAEQLTEQIAKQYNLQFDISYTEIFPATVNHPRMVKVVEKSAKKLELEILELTEPMRWSEDFGHFTNLIPGALIGLGSGTDQPDLHNPDYDFPDELIETGVKLFYKIFLNTIDLGK